MYSGQHKEEKERKRKLLDRLEDEETYNTELRRRKIEIELQRGDMMFKAQFQERADMNNDSRYIMRHKLQRELQDTFLDNTHDRARDFVAERSNTMLAISGARTTATSLITASATQFSKSEEIIEHEEDTPGEEYFLK